LQEAEDSSLKNSQIRDKEIRDLLVFLVLPFSSKGGLFLIIFRVMIRVRKMYMCASIYSFSGHFVLFLYQLAYNSEILSIFAPTYQNLATQFSSNPSPQ
jgi:hypothetical protein